MGAWHVEEQELTRKEASKRNRPHHSSSSVCGKGLRLPPAKDIAEGKVREMV
jgi:hypothetical protein